MIDMTSDLLSERMAALARDLHSHIGNGGTLHTVVHAACDLIEGCDSAGVTLVTSRGVVHSAASTDTLHDKVNALQSELHEGPCLDALWRDEVVVVPDLDKDSRWPRWRPAAIDAFRLRSMICVRLFTHEEQLGSLNFFSRHTGGLSEDDVEEAVAIAAQAAVAFSASDSHANLTTAMSNRTVIGQATGLTMAKYGLNSVAALGLLKRLSSEQNRKLALIAAEIVALWNEKGDL
jgi:GAF domain-containing protein